MSRFVLQLGDHAVRLTPGTWRIGRDPTCEIHLADESVSRRHATLRVTDDAVRLTDHGSRNGVRVNDERLVGEVALAPNDRVDIGTERLALVEQDPHDAAEGVPPTRPLPRPDATPRPGALGQLSARERQVLERLAYGETQRSIAEALGLSVKTVETYRARIGEKLELRTRADLVRYALEAGLLATEKREA